MTQDRDEGEEQRIFTVEEANAFVPHVREQLEFMQARKAELDRLGPEIERLEKHLGSNGHSGGNIDELKRKAFIAQGMIEAKMANLRGIGCELKGIDPGLVDFRSERDGRVVYLCWREGEDEVAYWHELDTGFAGRQPL